MWINNNKMERSYSRDFTYIDNVIQASELAAITPSETIRKKLKEYFSSKPNLEQGTLNQPSRKAAIEPETLNTEHIYEVFNVAYGGNTTLFELYDALKSNLSQFDAAIGEIEVTIGPKRAGDIPHSMASVDKIKAVLGYTPEFDAQQGFREACEWYYDNLK